MPPWRPLSTSPGRTKNGYAGVAELAVGEERPEVAGRAIAAPEEELEPALRRRRIALRGGPVTRDQRVAEVVERRARRHQRLLERRQRFRPVDEELLVVRAGPFAESTFVSAGQRLVLAQQLRRRPTRCSPFPWHRAAAAGSASRASRPRRPSRTNAGVRHSTGWACDGRARPCRSRAPARRASRGRPDGSCRRSPAGSTTGVAPRTDAARA